MPCASIMYIAPLLPSGVRLARPSVTKPMWLTDEYATSFLKSVCAMATSAP